MTKLVLSPLSGAQTDRFTDHPAHMLILVGPDGSGKTAVAQTILETVIGIRPGQLANNPFCLVVSPEKGTISIDSVRKLQKFMNLKTAGKAELRRGVIIEHGDKLTIEAQNALLKLMEEPPTDTVIVMTVNSPRALLPTMYSRSQIITLRRAPKDNLIGHFKSLGYQDDAINRAYSLTDGLPGLMEALLSKDSEHPLSEAVEVAKKVLRASRYERLTLINELSKDKPKLHDLLFALQRIAKASLSQTITSGNVNSVKRWHKILRETLIADNQLTLNANAKLVLTNLFLSI